MKITVRLLLVLVLIVVAAPAYSDEIMQIWKCEMEADTTEVEVEELAEAWLKAVRQMDGGEAARVSVLFPVVVSNTGQTDFAFVMTSPSFTDWGKFWDGFSDSSPAAEADEMNAGKVVCPDSELWEVVILGEK